MTKKEKFLSPEEITVCQQIATKSDLHGKRAKVLLAINDGTTHANAGNEAGLSNGQVRYLLKTFRLKRSSMFPPDSVDKKAAKTNKSLTEKTTKQPEGETKMAKKSKSKKKKKDKDKTKKKKDKQKSKKSKKKKKKKKAKKKKKEKKSAKNKKSK